MGVNYSAEERCSISSERHWSHGLRAPDTAKEMPSKAHISEDLSLKLSGTHMSERRFDSKGEVIWATVHRFHLQMNKGLPIYQSPSRTCPMQPPTCSLTSSSLLIWPGEEPITILKATVAGKQHCACQILFHFPLSEHTGR